MLCGRNDRPVAQREKKAESQELCCVWKIGRGESERRCEEFQVKEPNTDMQCRGHRVLGKYHLMMSADDWRTG